MNEEEKWVCSSDSSHIFKEDSEDHFCPLDPPFHGFLIKEEGPVKEFKAQILSPAEGQVFKAGANIAITAQAASTVGTINKIEFFKEGSKIGEALAPPYVFNFLHAEEGAHVFSVKAWNSIGNNVSSAPVNIKVKNGGSSGEEIGLCVLMMDASSSMTELAFEGSLITKMHLISTSAANGIFELERLQNNQHAYIAAFKFDDRVKLMFVDSVANLLKRFEKDVKKFAAYIYDELFEMQQGTDINKALQQAYDFVNRFLKKDLPEFPVKNYKPIIQRVLKLNLMESVSIANIRVLMYTDGMQFSSTGDKTLLPNPFKEHPLPELNHDVVIGAFFGQEKDEGCEALKTLLSKCPVHDVRQFFLFQNPAEINNLKNLFRMASGASGFCPLCLQTSLSP